MKKFIYMFLFMSVIVPHADKFEKAVTGIISGFIAKEYYDDWNGNNRNKDRHGLPRSQQREIERIKPPTAPGSFKITTSNDK